MRQRYRERLRKNSIVCQYVRRKNGLTLGIDCDSILLLFSQKNNNAVDYFVN
jgi:hypothetical protein